MPMFYPCEIADKIAEAKRRHVRDFSFVDHEGKRVEVRILDNDDICVDTDFL